jgi:integrase
VLTDLRIKSLPFEERQRDYPDRDGMFLRIGRETKTFMVAIHTGTRRRVAIGRYPEWSLSRARQKAAELRTQARLKKDEPLTITFREAVDQYTHLHLPSTRTGSQKQATRLLARFPSLMPRKLGDLTPVALTAALDRIAAPSERLNAYTYLSAVLRWSYQRGYLSENPIARLKPPGRSVERERVLSDAELIRIWNAGEGLHGAYIRLLILSAQRKSQFLKFNADWIESDTIVFPGTSMKAGKVQVLPLTPYIRECLHFLPFSFCEQRQKRDLMVRSQTENWRVHDLRRSTATKLAEDLHIPWHLIARLLSHATPGETGRYVRATYIPELRAAMLAWQDRLEQLGARF